MTANYDAPLIDLAIIEIIAKNLDPSVFQPGIHYDQVEHRRSFARERARAAYTDICKTYTIAPRIGDQTDERSA